MSRFFPAPADCGRHTIFGSTQVRTYAGDQLQLSLADIPAHAVIDWHDHPNEQLGLVIRGRATFDIGDESRTLGPGEFFFIPAGVRHRVTAHDEPVQALDTFYPIRPEYR
jgi:quercetin dioxygenase-like cupin family protein